MKNKKALRIVALVLANTGLFVSLLYLIFFMIGALVPDAASFARLDFFVFDYFYLIIPLLCLVSGILLQLASNRAKRKRTASTAQRSKN